MESINASHVWLLASVLLLPVISIGLNFRQLKNAKTHKRLVSHYSRFISTRQAANDIIEVIVFNVLNSKNYFLHARDVIKSLQQSDNSNQQGLDQVVNNYNAFSLQFDKDNKLSVDRSYTNDIPARAPSDSPFKSIWFWIPVTLAYGLLLLTYFKDSYVKNGVWLTAVFFIVVVETIFLFISLKRFNRTRRLVQNTENQLLTILGLMDIRRIFIKDSIQKIYDHMSQLQPYEQLCHSIPQARSYSRGLLILKRNYEVLKSVYQVTDINVEVPLISVSPLLQKAVTNQYAPKAQSKNIKFTNNIQPGLSLYISPSNLSLLIDPLIANAVDFSKPGQTITLNGIPRPNKVELEIIDQGQPISDEELANLFKFNPEKSSTPESGHISLSLRLARLIVSTLGGEIKVSNSKNIGTKIKLILPKNRNQEVIYSTPKIGKVASRLGAR